MLAIESLALESILKILHIFIGKQLEQFIDFLLIELFFDDFHIDNGGQVGGLEYFPWKGEGLPFVVEVKVGTINDDILLGIHWMQLERWHLGENVDLTLQSLFDVVVGLGAVVAVVRIVE